jgi:Protein of unknown function (DUF2637)
MNRAGGGPMTAPSWSVRIAAMLTAAVVLGAAVLSWDALSWGAEQLGVDGRLTWLYPVVIDGVIGVATVAALALRSTQYRIRAYVWALLAGAIGASVVGNGAHAAGGSPIHIVGAAVPAVALAASLHLLIVLVRHAPTARGVVGDQVGYVEPVEPEPHARAIDSTERALPAPKHARSARVTKRASRGTRHEEVRALLAEPGGRALTGREIGERLGIDAGRARSLRAEVERADAEAERRPRVTELEAAAPAAAAVAEEGLNS